MELNGKTAIVTGGNGGIGLAISTALAGVGMNILIAGRRQHPNESVARELAQRHGVRNICSVAGKQAWSGSGTYSASKFGVLALTQALADEGKEHDIKATAVCPAMVATPLTGVSGPDYLQPEDCAETVLYLLRLSPAAWPTEIVLERKGAD